MLLEISVLAEMREMVDGSMMNLGLNTTEKKNVKHEVNKNKLKRMLTCQMDPMVSCKLTNCHHPLMTPWVTLTVAR